MQMKILPLPENWDATNETLHLYSRVIGVVARLHAPTQPHWWHVSLRLDGDGYLSQAMPLPGGGAFRLRMDLGSHEVELLTGGTRQHAWPMDAGLSATQLAANVFAAVADYGLTGDYPLEKYADDQPRRYNPAHAAAWFAAISAIDSLLETRRSSLTGERGPVQLWPHGFDIAFEWFGKTLSFPDERGHPVNYPAQISLGFSPGERYHPAPYFYSNPYPFDDQRLKKHTLVHGARWFNNGWQGSVLEYDSVAGDPAGAEKFLEYAQTLFDLASPDLRI